MEWRKPAWDEPQRPPSMDTCQSFSSWVCGAFASLERRRCYGKGDYRPLRPPPKIGDCNSFFFLETLYLQQFAIVPRASTYATEVLAFA